MDEGATGLIGQREKVCREEKRQNRADITGKRHKKEFKKKEDKKEKLRKK